MTVETSDLKVVVHPAEELVRGQFDHGRIREIKPIGFPGEALKTSRIGPLFYWAWASAGGYAKIPMHPHQGFEIISYVLSGELAHSDTLGTRSRVKAGGAQIMQTGSGVSHQEETLEENTQFLQIWFEPDLRKSLKASPRYYELNEDDFPVTEEGEIHVKTVLGPDAPVELAADCQALDIAVPSGTTYARPLKSGRSLAVLTLKGSGHWLVSDPPPAFKPRDFSVAETSRDSTISIQAGDPDVQLFLVEVPIDPGYPLYPSRR